MRDILLTLFCKKINHSKCTGPEILDATERHQSEVINTLRFPLIVMIVLFHMYPPEEAIVSPYTSYNLIATFFSAHGISQLAVPTFFLISGYFFYYHLKIWNKTVYAQKLRKRIKTLLIPYLLWNGIPFLAIILVRTIIGMSSGISLNLVKEFGNSVSWLRAFWDCGIPNGHPFDVPLWYVRDLIVCSLCSPVIYFLIRKLGAIYILLLAACFISNIWLNLTGFSARAWFFFSFGAYLSVNKVNMVCMLRKTATVAVPLSIALLIITTFFSPILRWTKPYFDNLFLLSGVCALIGSVSYLVSNGIIRNVPVLTKSVFFIYAFHVLPLPGIESVTSLSKFLTGKFVVEEYVVTYFFQLIVCPIAVICACLAIYYFMHRYTPRLLSVLMGYR